MIYVMLAGVLVLAVGLGMAGLVARVGRVGVRIGPWARARIAGAGVVGAVGLVFAGLAITAAAAASALLPSSALVAWPRLASDAGAVPQLVGLVAGCVLLMSVGAVGVVVARLRCEQRVLRVGARIGEHWDRVGFELVVLPVAAPLAYSLGGRRPQVVLSAGLCDLLDRDGQAAVIAHEAAHVYGRHDRWLRLASVADAAVWFVPWMKSATGVVRSSLEQWADLEAAREVGSERLREALLAVVGIRPSPSPAASLSGAAALGERLALLESFGQRHNQGGLRLAATRSALPIVVAALAGAGGIFAALAALERLCGG